MKALCKQLNHNHCLTNSYDSMKGLCINQLVIHPEGDKQLTITSCLQENQVLTLQRALHPCVTFLKLDPCVSFN